MLKINKKWLVALLTASGITLTTSAIITYNNAKTEKEEIGYDDFGFINKFKIDENDFIILDIGNHKKVGVHYQDFKIEYCNKKDISLGVIISSNAENESDIYNDVEYIKSVLREHSLNLPIYLDINNIIMNDNLNVETKTKLIKNFLEKCNANNIYAGIYGTDTNLCRVKKYCKITDYDAFLVMDNQEIKYDGIYHVYQDLEKNIIKTKNLSKMIEEKTLNDAQKFVNDSTCIVNTKEEMTDIALKYGMSVNELLNFNEIKKKDLTSPQEIIIPSSLAKQVPRANQEYDILETPLRGCDLSYAQGNHNNWNELKKNFEFIILKCNQGVLLDSCFEYNARNCNLYDIPIGVYCYNDYDKNNCENIEKFKERQQEQANFTIEMLQNKKIEYPIYLDIESNCDLKELFTPEHIQQMLNIWSDTMLASGYIPGLYCNQSTLQFLKSCVNYDLSDKLELWIAGGEQYYGEEKDIELNQVKPPAILEDTNTKITMAQVTDSAINTGAGNAKGHLDINFSSVNYQEANMEIEGKQDIIKKQFTRRDYKLYGEYALSFLLAGTSTGILIKRKRKKAKEKKKCIDF